MNRNNWPGFPGYPGFFGHYQIIENDKMVKPLIRLQRNPNIKRRQRLTKRPKTVKTRTIYIPSQEILENRRDHVLIMHPIMADRLRKYMDREFTIRIPAELDRDPDLVLSIAASRLLNMEAMLNVLMQGCEAICEAYNHGQPYRVQEWFEPTVQRIKYAFQNGNLPPRDTAK